MDCPDCQTKLTVSFYEGAHIHFCIQCHGSLVGASELRTILERHEEEVSRDGGIPDRGQASEPRTCPGCATTMVHEQFMDAVTIDRCASCERVWLDPHELEDIQFHAEMGHPHDC